MATKPDLDLVLTRHAQDRMGERGFSTFDILEVLRTGFVHDSSQPGRTPSAFVYAMEARALADSRRVVRVIVSVDHALSRMKVVTVMFADEAR